MQKAEADSSMYHCHRDQALSPEMIIYGRQGVEVPSLERCYLRMCLNLLHTAPFRVSWAQGWLQGLCISFQIPWFTAEAGLRWL